MKNLLLFVFGILVLSSAYAQPFFEQDRKENAVRDRYLVERYSLTSDQLSDYGEAIEEFHHALVILYDQNMTKDEWKRVYKEVSDALKKEIESVLTPAQYASWIKDNRGSNTIRRYRENLGLDDTALDRVLAIIRQCDKSISELVKEKVSYLERSERQKAIYSKRKKDLTAVLGKENCERLEFDLFLEDKAAFVRRHMPEFSRKRSYDIGELYREYSQAVFAADWSDDSPSVKQERKHTAYLSFLKKMQSCLTPEEYEIWNVRHFAYHDGRVRHDLSLNEQQFEVYKEILNNRAVERYMIAKKGFKGEAKEQKFNAIDAQIKAEMEERLSPEAAAMWYANLKKEK